MKENDFRIYPNPASRGAEMIIQLAEGVSTSIESIEIANIIGQVVANYTSIKAMNTSTLAKGIYFVSIKTTEHYLKVKKLVIE